ncbi:MAG: FecR domain-containing protein [Myxococcales bacterium]|nr:FecR domain-containing protein [Myxococcales bacterium]
MKTSSLAGPCAIAALSLLAVPAQSWAAVGKVAVLDGSANRTAGGGKSEPLSVGTAIELRDTIEVKQGTLKLELSDGSAIVLSEGSALRIDEAEFAGQERKGFSALLSAAKQGLAKLWAKVAQAGSGAKFEVRTERAVAGVRGTVFRVDADKEVRTSRGSQWATVVRVAEGKVGVRPSKQLAQAPKPKGGKKDRVQVPGPREVSAQKWEELFAELQKNQQIAVGIDLWELTQVDPGERDDFDRWVDQHP